MTDVQRIDLDEVVRYCAEMEDSRSSVKLQYPAAGVIVIALLVVLAGASESTAIARWAGLKE